MIRTLKLKHDEIYPDGEWRTIANESDIDNVDNELIYYYLENDIDLSAFNVGDMIDLDERFEIINVLDK